MKSWEKALLVVSGLVPLLGLFSRPPDTMLLIYTFFVVVFLLVRIYMYVFVMDADVAEGKFNR